MRQRQIEVKNLEKRILVLSLAQKRGGGRTHTSGLEKGDNIKSMESGSVQGRKKIQRKRFGRGEEDQGTLIEEPKGELYQNASQ